ncbi:MAG TPA: hypothetical protein VE753_06740 [Gaiellaceae bacterium]|jgi:hypothetical protein|nr:hypothetical protein [Gaiellaceae bacterium]
MLATFGISLVFAYLALRGIDFDATWQALRRSDYSWVVPSLAALALSIPALDHGALRRDGRSERLAVPDPLRGRAHARVARGARDTANCGLTTALLAFAGLVWADWASSNEALGALLGQSSSRIIAVPVAVAFAAILQLATPDERA